MWLHSSSLHFHILFPFLRRVFFSGVSFITNFQGIQKLRGSILKRSVIKLHFTSRKVYLECPSKNGVIKLHLRVENTFRATQIPKMTISTRKMQFCNTKIRPVKGIKLSGQLNCTDQKKTLCPGGLVLVLSTIQNDILIFSALRANPPIQHTILSPKISPLWRTPTLIFGYCDRTINYVKYSK